MRLKFAKFWGVQNFCPRVYILDLTHHNENIKKTYYPSIETNYRAYVPGKTYFFKKTMATEWLINPFNKESDKLTCTVIIPSAKKSINRSVFLGY